jgi:isocitrate dehydrogenase
MSTIIYTKTDEAPALATYSFLPIVKAFTDAAGIDVETRDISLAGRILATFPDKLTEDQRIDDALAELGELAKTPEANIIKLPNISASIPQLVAAIEELQSQGFDIPDYPEEPSNEAEAAIRDRYAKVLGSAVNPVLREGNSDRRVALAVKNYAKAHPHRMGAWSSESKSHVAHMDDKDFYSSEQSAVVARAGNLRIEHADADGNVTVLRDAVPVLDNEVVDSSVMDCAALSAFFAREIDAAKDEGVLFSLHLKATMMKVSDPIMFGHCVRAYYGDVFEKHGALFDELGVDANNGIGDAYAKIAGLPEAQRAEIEADLNAVYETRPPQAMVDSDKGITNLHVPSNVIIDASMPAARCGALTEISPTPRWSFPIAAMPGSTRRSCSTARTTAPSTLRRWATSAMSGSWRRRPKSTGRTTRPLRSHRPAPSGLSMLTAMPLWSTQLTGVISGACARRRTCRFVTGSSLR